MTLCITAIPGTCLRHDILHHALPTYCQSCRTITRTPFSELHPLGTNASRQAPRHVVARTQLSELHSLGLTLPRHALGAAGRDSICDLVICPATFLAFLGQIKSYPTLFSRSARTFFILCQRPFSRTAQHTVLDPGDGS